MGTWGCNISLGAGHSQTRGGGGFRIEIKYFFPAILKSVIIFFHASGVIALFFFAVRAILENFFHICICSVWGNHWNKLWAFFTKMENKLFFFTQMENKYLFSPKVKTKYFFQKKPSPPLACKWHGPLSGFKNIVAWVVQAVAPQAMVSGPSQAVAYITYNAVVYGTLGYGTGTLCCSIGLPDCSLYTLGCGMVTSGCSFDTSGWGMGTPVYSMGMLCCDIYAPTSDCGMGTAVCSMGILGCDIYAP